MNILALAECPIIEGILIHWQLDIEVKEVKNFIILY